MRSIGRQGGGKGGRYNIKGDKGGKVVHPECASTVVRESKDVRFRGIN